MTLTDFFTLCWKKLHFDVLQASGRVFLPLSLFLITGLAHIPARADSVLAELSNFEVERAEDGVFVSTVVKFELPSVVEDVLRKGIPVYFVAEAELRRDRWYWTDKRVSLTARHLRLAYQPLLRRWRLQVGANPIGNNGLGVALNQNFESLPDALASIQRFSRWKIADAGALESDAKYNVDFQFRLDVSQLPRPFQIGALGQSEWTLAASRNMKLPAEASK